MTLRCTGPAPYLISLATVVSIDRGTVVDPVSEPIMDASATPPIETHPATAECLGEPVECTAVRASIKLSQTLPTRITINY